VALMRAIAIVGLALTLALGASAAPARAEERPTSEVIGEEMRGWGKQLVLKLDMFELRPEDEGPPGYDAALKLDVEQRRAHISLGGGDPDIFSLRFDANLWPDRGAMRTAVVVKLGLVGEQLQLSLPDVRVKPQKLYGEYGVELSVPLIEGHF
jgi:hypothetical protein